MTTGMLLAVLAAGLVALFWRSSVESRERANAAAHDACEHAGLQLLDGTVAFKSWRAARDDSGRFALRRTYVFDYSDDGASRRQGFVVMRGHRVEIVGLGPTLVPGRAA